jgi:hypothetical protein
VSAELRAVVSAVVREVVAEAVGAAARSETPGVPAAPGVAAAGSGVPVAGHLEPTGPRRAAGRSRVETVRLTGSADLQGFVHRLLELFENPGTREEVRTGRWRFELAGGVAAAAAPGSVERVDRGAVTERMVAAAASTGSRLVLGPRAVLTPLAREKARSLGVLVEKERR